VLYRIFNFSPNGYIVITADDNVRPVIGYGLNTNFNFDTAPPALLYLLGEYKLEMEYIVKNKLKADDTITADWGKYSDENYIPLKSYSVGTKLLKTNWDQKSPYNNSCPLDPNTGSRCLVGCTAVALGQILNYWDCKVFPDGSISYTPNGFSAPLSINFYDQVYDWNDIGTVAASTAQFLYHCALSVESDFGSSGTSSNMYLARIALVNFFGFNANYPVSKSSYTNAEWVNLLKGEISSERPIFYRGQCDTCSVGHAWVIDGYEATDEFHCN